MTVVNIQQHSMKKLLRFFGADDKEAEIYLKLLELGAQPISVIAKHAGIPRPSMYVVLERLKKLQLIDEFSHNGIKYAKSISVNGLEDLLKLKEKKLQQVSSMLHEKKTEFLALENKLSSTPSVKFYQGKLEVMKMYEEVLREGGFCSVFNPQLVKKIMPEYYYKIGEILKKNLWKAKELTVECTEAHEYTKRFKSKLHQIKMLPSYMIFKSDIIMSGENLYMISYGEIDLTGTRITNAALTETQRILFEYVWKSV